MATIQTHFTIANVGLLLSPYYFAPNQKPSSVTVLMVWHRPGLQDSLHPGTLHRGICGCFAKRSVTSHLPLQWVKWTLPSHTNRQWLTMWWPICYRIISEEKLRELCLKWQSQNPSNLTPKHVYFHLILCLMQVSGKVGSGREVSHISD